MGNEPMIVTIFKYAAAVAALVIGGYTVYAVLKDEKEMRDNDRG